MRYGPPPRTRSGRRLVYTFERTELSRLITEAVQNIEAETRGETADLYEALEVLMPLVYEDGSDAKDNAYNTVKAILEGED